MTERATAPEGDLPGMLAVAKGVATQKWPHSMDAQVWAKEFMTRYAGMTDLDEGDMIGWFANAIMAGYDTANARRSPTVAQDAARFQCWWANRNCLRENGIDIAAHIELDTWRDRIDQLRLKNAAPQGGIGTLATDAAVAPAESAPVCVVAPKGWPWKGGSISIPTAILQQCEVWVGTAAYTGIQAEYEDGTDTPNRTQLLKLHAELRALLNQSPPERDGN